MAIALDGGMLSQDQTQAYWDDGYLFPIPGVGTNQAAKWRAELETIERDWLDNGLPRSLNTYKRVNAHLVMPLAHDIGTHPAILDVVQGVMGPDIMLYSVEFMTKEAHTNAVVTMHQDLAYWGYGESDGADINWVISALLHDIGDIFAPYNHTEYAAAILRPFVREQCTWVVEKHGDFQMLYYGHHVGGNQHKREQYRGHIYFDDCAAFCERWDQASFDPDYDTLPIEHFADRVRQVFAREPYDPAVIRTGAREPLYL